MKTFDEIIKGRYPFYNPDIEQKDVELNGEQVKELMRQAALQVIDRCRESVDSYHKYRDYCDISPTEVITQIENVKSELQ